MIEKGLRIYFTIKYLKRKQIFFQVWYRLKKKIIKINNYNKYVHQKLYNYETKSGDLLFINKNLLESDLKFNFIGKSHTFQNKVDWNFKNFGKLWNYNLQYLNYINDESINLDLRLKLINDLSNEIITNNVAVEPYPVSIRIINLFLFHQKHPIKNKTVTKSLLLQVNYLENNLEYHLLANHLLENIFSLFIAGHFLMDKHLIQKSSKLLINELEEQILNDGAHYECSPMYHSIILSKLFLCIEVGRQQNILKREDLLYLENKASIMFSWLKSFSFPDGSWPLFNDSALGITAGTLRLKKCLDFLKLPYHLVSLSDSGYRKLIYNNLHVIVKTGNIQPSYQPGHIHSDMLSYCVWYNGNEIIVDPGISTYEDCSTRLFEKSTANHNTISINSESQSDLWSSFRIGKRSKCNVLKNEDNCLVLSVSNFYNNKNIEHFRSISILKNTLCIKDIISNCLPSDTPSNSIHFNHNINLSFVGNNIVSKDFTLEFLSGCSDLEILDYDQSIFFGKKIPSKKIYFINKNQSSILMSFN